MDAAVGDAYGDVGAGLDAGDRADDVAVGVLEYGVPAPQRGQGGQCAGAARW